MMVVSMNSFRLSPTGLWPLANVCDGMGNKKRLA
jgi:hypothetical protein